MQLAIGDALAVALLEARGFTADDFRTFHPGGKLGASLTHVARYHAYRRRLPLVPLGTPMPEAMMVLSQKRFGCVGVHDDEGRLAASSPMATSPATCTAILRRWRSTRS